MKFSYEISKLDEMIENIRNRFKEFKDVVISKETIICDNSIISINFGYDKKIKPLIFMVDKEMNNDALIEFERFIGRSIQNQIVKYLRNEKEVFL